MDDTRMMLDVRALDRIRDVFLGYADRSILFPEEEFLMGWMQGMEMNAARMKKCMDQGRSREQCMKEIYPDQASKKPLKKTKKTPTRSPRGSRSYI